MNFLVMSATPKYFCCPECGKKILVNLDGKEYQCKRCGEFYQVTNNKSKGSSILGCRGCGSFKLTHKWINERKHIMGYKCIDCGQSGISCSLCGNTGLVETWADSAFDQIFRGDRRVTCKNCGYSWIQGESITGL
jgi:DNA-directed RNA polymerase subunit RPC12/RpoP